MNNLEPRAKIGDVVIVKESYLHNRWENEIEQYKVQVASWNGRIWWYQGRPGSCFIDKDILKNLTTNVSYE